MMGCEAGLLRRSVSSKSLFLCLFNLQIIHNILNKISFLLAFVFTFIAVTHDILDLKAKRMGAGLKRFEQNPIAVGRDGVDAHTLVPALNISLKPEATGGFRTELSRVWNDFIIERNFYAQKSVGLDLSVDLGA